MGSWQSIGSWTSYLAIEDQEWPQRQSEGFSYFLLVGTSETIRRHSEVIIAVTLAHISMLRQLMS